MSIKSGFVAVIGLPNAGKSTLINSLLNEHLLITSAKSQTTRRHLRAILTGDDYQLVFVDTPGLHEPKNKLGEFMAREVLTALESCDAVLYILDSTCPEPRLMEAYTGSKPIILVLNKIDLLGPGEAEELAAQFEADGRFAKVVPVSALGRRNLEQIVNSLLPYLPEGGMLYPEDQLLDTDYRFLASELIREQALLQLEDEVPHGIAVEIENFTEDEQEAVISASIIVERESHKGIVIGKGGKMLGTIGKGARLDIQDLLKKKVHLKLWVKVKKNWRKDPNQLKWLGYR